MDIKVQKSIPFNETTNSVCSPCSTRIASRFSIRNSGYDSVVKTEFDRNELYDSAIGDTQSFVAAKKQKTKYKGNGEKQDKCIIM